MDQKVEVVTLGETMVLFSTEQPTAFEYAHSFTKQIGGAESNLAIGLQRLGHQVGWISKLGDDPFGRYIKQVIRGEGVDTSRCIHTDVAPTAVFFKEKKSATNLNVYYYRQHSAASLLQPEDLDEAYIAQAKVLHVTGITPALSESCLLTVLKAMDIARSHGVIVCFDPNIRLKLWSKDKAQQVLKQMISKADIILPGLDEGEFLTGQATPQEVINHLRTNDNQTFVVKLGSEGAYYDHEGQQGQVPGFTAQVVDPVGAGDGFAAGIISGYVRGLPIEETVRRANAIGAIVVGVNGDMEGLPRAKELEEFLNQTDEQDVKR